MTDKLRAAAEMMFESLANAHESLIDVENALRQALAEPDNDADCDDDTGIDRGAWADVPDATKWVDELRGDDEPPTSTTDVVEPIGEIIEAHGLIAVSIPKMPPVGTKLYAAPPKDKELPPVKTYCGDKPNYCEQDLVYRLRKRAEIRRQIDTRKSVQEGKPDRIADLLEEAADYIEELEKGSENVLA